ncbi:MAG: PGF-pre-PGF domain-containing protein, partial [Candidatus Nanoarchaeia archaeon]
IEFTPSENDVGTHKIKITVKDLENETDSEIFTLRINGVTDGGGARGGGLSSSIYSNWSFSKSWLNLKAGSPISFEVFISDLPITYMTLFPTATSSNAAIGIRKVSKPVNVETPDYPLTYFEISKTNLALAYAKLKFKISKSWKSQNYIEQIYLAKLQGNDWLKQPLVLVSENLNEEEYEATLNTFSLFVIAGVQNIPIMANASLETDGGKNISLQNISLTQQNEGKKDFANFTNIVIFLSVLFGLFILISAIILKQYRNKPKAKPIIIQTKESVDFDF